MIKIVWKMQQKKMIRKLAVSIVTALLLLLLYILIFSFSEQDAETSGSLSYMISETTVEVINSLTGRNWTDKFMAELANYFEHPIRKLAHFSEYACMGILLYVLWRQWKIPGKRVYLLIILWVLLSATGDEIHQLFVQGRSGNIADVLLDTCGGAFGLFCCVWLEKLLRHCVNPVALTR